MRDLPALSADTVFRFGFIAELGLVAVAALLGYLFEGQPFPFDFRFDWTSLWQSAAATAPMLLVALLATSQLGMRLAPLRRIYLTIRKILGPALCKMDGMQIVLLSCAAGVGEETLFRGVLQGSWGIVVTSLVFGLFHAVTVTYFILAVLISLYFGWLMEATGNLLPPLIGHSVYDAVALFLLRKRFRAEGFEDAEDGADVEADKEQVQEEQLALHDDPEESGEVGPPDEASEAEEPPSDQREQ